MDDPADWPRCELCDRQVPRRLMTLHHLVPKQKGGRPGDRRRLCKPCHKQVHATFGNADLARDYATLDRLRAAGPLQPFLAWVRRQRPDRKFQVARSDLRPAAGRRRR